MGYAWAVPPPPPSPAIQAREWLAEEAPGLYAWFKGRVEAHDASLLTELQRELEPFPPGEPWSHALVGTPLPSLNTTFVCAPPLLLFPTELEAIVTLADGSAHAITVAGADTMTAVGQRLGGTVVDVVFPDGRPPPPLPTPCPDAQHANSSCPAHPRLRIHTRCTRRGGAGPATDPGPSGGHGLQGSRQVVAVVWGGLPPPPPPLYLVAATRE